MNRSASPVADLAVLLGRAYLRLAEKQRNCADSRASEAHKRLDSPPDRSAPVNRERARWKTACLVKSTGSAG
jgi:hypothetical protein